MYNPRRNDSRSGGFGGGRDFRDRDSHGSRGSYDRDSRDRERIMFKATCAECNSACEVPFKPNGSKPVLCSNCFKRDDKPRFGNNDRGGSRDDFSRKPAFDRPTAAPTVNLSKLEEQVRTMNVKLDAVLKALKVNMAPAQPALSLDMDAEEVPFQKKEKAVKAEKAPKEKKEKKAAKKKK
ncbi:MAG: CxxC-x17-CxxC domain-containing protein [Patescibacteria group bacterium]